MDEQQINDYLFGGGEESTAPTYVDVPTFDASSLADLYSGVDTNYLSDFFSNISSGVSNLFADKDLTNYFDTATPGYQSFVGEGAPSILNPDRSEEHTSELQSH